MSNPIAEMLGPARVNLYRSTLVARESLKPFKPESLSDEDLAKTTIQVQQMSLTPQSDNSTQPRYCRLLPGDSLDKILSGTIGSKHEIESWPSYAPEFVGGKFYMADQYVNSLVQLIGTSRYHLHPLSKTKWIGRAQSSNLFRFQRHDYDVKSGVVPVFGTSYMYSVRDYSQPHVAAVICDDILADDDGESLRRSEIFCALKIIQGSILRDRKRTRFDVYPAYIYSFSDCKARVLEVFNEADKIIIRKTEYLDMKEADADNMKGIKILMQWLLSEPLPVPGLLTVKAESDIVSNTSSKPELSDSASERSSDSASETSSDSASGTSSQK